MSFFTPKSEWTPPDLATLPSWKGVKRVSLDSETHDPHLTTHGPGTMRDGRTVGWSFTLEGGPSFYLPTRHQGGDNLPLDAVNRYLGEQLKHFDGEIVGANLAYDIDYAYTDGFEFNPNVKFRDIQIADPLIYELHMSYSLKEIGKRLGVESKDESLLFEAARSFGLDPKKGLWRLPARYVGPYAEMDTQSPLDLYAKQREILDKEDLWQIFNIESDVTPALVRMRRRGVRIDQDKLRQIEIWAEQEEIKALKFIKDETLVDIGLGNVWKAGALAPALEAIGIRLGRTSTGAPNIDKFILAGAKHPVAAAILRARKVNKLRTTFAASIWKYLVNGRIHCSFKQIAQADEDGEQKGVRYGRLSAVDPNLQQQPSPDRDPEIAGEWRKIFIPEEGAIWGCGDYSQQEPRWTTHFAALMKLPKAEEAARRYRDDPSTDNHDMMTRLAHGDEQVDKWFAEYETGISKHYKVYRGYCKNIFLGLCYGEGEAKLCHDLGLPTEWAHITGYGSNRNVHRFTTRHEAMMSRVEMETGYVKEVAGEEGSRVLEKFDAEVPYVRMLAKAATERAGEKGFVRTIGGRRLHFERRDDGTYDYTHKALNRIIQGSSADQTKYALVQLDKAGYFLQLQVHDEMDGSFGTVEEAQGMGDIMRECVKDFSNPLVPFKVDVETGPSWGQVK